MEPLQALFRKWQPLSKGAGLLTSRRARIASSCVLSNRRTAYHGRVDCSLTHGLATRSICTNRFFLPYVDYKGWTSRHVAVSSIVAGHWRFGGVRWATCMHDILANADIPFSRVRVVDGSGLVGDFFINEARALARQRRTDLVVLSADVHPPLCRLVSLDDYTDELDKKAAAEEKNQSARRLRQFSFDPALKVKGMRFTAMVDEHDLERKVNQVRAFLANGHRVEARILQGRCPPEDVLDLGLRIISELRDIAKPEFLEESVREFRSAVNAPKSLKRAGKSAADELRLRLWPCTPEQAAAFTLPTQILGPRRRRGANIAGVDDGEQPEDAWKLHRKPKGRKYGATTRILKRQALEDD